MVQKNCSEPSSLLIRGRGGFKILKRKFRITVGPKGSLSGPNFCLGFDTPRRLGAARWLHPFFRQIVMVDNSLLSSHKNYQFNRPKNNSVMAKKLVQNYGHARQFVPITLPTPSIIAKFLKQYHHCDKDVQDRTVHAL